MGTKTVARTMAPQVRVRSMHILIQRAQTLQQKLPLVRRMPAPALTIIMTVLTVNVFVWAAIGVVLSFHGALSGTAILAYTLGLRHALDADHISAIDLMTRRLVAANQKPVTVGTFFSLGHSTVVIVTCIVVAATASSISNRFGAFSHVGGIIGASVSAAFLIILGAANTYILFLLVRQLRRHLSQCVAGENPELKLEGKGVIFTLFKKLFRLVDRPWKMYPLGLLFGLGFDTSSEVALLGISSIQGVRGTSMWLILIFPVLFTAAMCLVDTIDGSLMMVLYTSASVSRDAVAILYYNIILTSITVIVAVVIGTLQTFSLVLSISTQKGRFWTGVKHVLDHYDVVGGCICGLFIVAGCMSVLCYGPWRRLVDSRMAVGAPSTETTDVEVTGPPDALEVSDLQLQKAERASELGTVKPIANGAESA